jgi:hypothetical protein
MMDQVDDIPGGIQDLGVFIHSAREEIARRWRDA